MVTELHINLVDLLIKRIYTGEVIAKAKVRSKPELSNLDKKQLWVMITYPAVEKQVVDSIKSWSKELGDLFETYVIQQTKLVHINTILSENN